MSTYRGSRHAEIQALIALLCQPVPPLPQKVGGLAEQRDGKAAA